MADQEYITDTYREMYRAMIEKDETGLSAVLDDSFVLVHMTGMRQDKTAFIKAVMDGTLNYYSAVHENMPIKLSGETAVLTGQSVVSAAVFGSGRHTWHLQLTCTMKKINGHWKVTQSIAVTY